MNAPAATKQYQKQQDELERQREMAEKAKDFTFISLMLKRFGIGEQK